MPSKQTKTPKSVPSMQKRHSPAPTPVYQYVFFLNQKTNSVPSFSHWEGPEFSFFKVESKSFLYL